MGRQESICNEVSRAGVRRGEGSDGELARISISAGAAKEDGGGNLRIFDLEVFDSCYLYEAFAGVV
jgi:hypothetical protein